MERVGIVSFAQTRHGPMPDKHLVDLVYEVSSAALERAGVKPGDIDVVVSASCDVLDGRSISNVFLVEAMGAFLKEESKVEEDGAWALFYAAQRLIAGPNRIALVVAHSKRTESEPWADSGLMAEPFFGRPAGLNGLSAAALQARVWLDRHGLPESVLAALAEEELARGARNPNAHRREAVRAGEAARSPVLASPLRELEVSPVSDGAAAVVVAVEEEARRLAKTPVWIEATGFSHDLAYPGHRDLAVVKSAGEAAKRAYQAAGIHDPRKDTAFAELSAGCAHQLPMLAEALGLADGPGLAGSAGRGGAGGYAFDPSGGALAADPGLATGLVRIGEAALQLRGEAGPHQLDAARPGAGGCRAIAHAAGGLALQSNLVMVLGVEGA